MTNRLPILMTLLLIQPVNASDQNLETIKCNPYNGDKNVSIIIPFELFKDIFSQQEFLKLNAEGKAACYKSSENDPEFIIECYQCCTG